MIDQRVVNCFFKNNRVAATYSLIRTGQQMLNIDVIAVGIFQASCDFFNRILPELTAALIDEISQLGINRPKPLIYYFKTIIF